MKHGRVAILAACLAGLAAAAWAGEDLGEGIPSPAVEFPSSVGVYGSTWNGGGLSYQRWFGDLGLGITAGGMVSPYSGVVAWNYNAQLDLMYKLYSSNAWRWLSGDLFLFAAIGHKASDQPTYISDPDNDVDTEDGYFKPGEYSPTFSLALGVGYEIVLFRHFSFPIQFGYAGEYPLALDFCASGGLRYRF